MADAVLLQTMWVRLISHDVPCIISVRDFDKGEHEDLHADGSEPRPTSAATEQRAAPVAPISSTDDTCAGDTEIDVQERDEWLDAIEQPVVPDIQTLNVAGAISILQETDWSAEGLYEFSAQETKGKGRVTVLRAIAAQRTELEE
jgi:hypothetical protein